MTAHPSHPSDDLSGQLAEATRLSGEGDWEAAFSLLLTLEEEHPEDATLLCMLGVAAEESAVPGMAYEYFRRCLQAEPVDPSVLATLGSGLARYDDPEAERVLRLASVTAPDLASTRLHYGAYLAREGLLDLALPELGAARALDPDDPRIPREIAIAHLLARSNEAAVQQLESALELDPEDPDTGLLLALALIRTGSLEEAGETLQVVVQALPQDPDPLLLAALTFASNDWLDAAWEALARAEATEGDADALLLREVEESLEAGPEAARRLLTREIAPSMLRQRLAERP